MTSELPAHEAEGTAKEVFRAITERIGVDMMQAHIDVAKNLAVRGLRVLVVDDLPEETGLEFRTGNGVKFRLGEFGPFVLGLEQAETVLATIQQPDSNL